MNVLLTCAGRRNYLARFFKDAVGEGGRVYAADASPMAPALTDVDGGFIVPSVHDPAYFDELIELCRLHEIGLLVPLNDLELPLLARQRERFQAIGCISVISSPDLIDVCFDKWQTMRFLDGYGLRTPRSFLSIDAALSALQGGELRYPVVVKPRWGTASIGIDFAEDDEELIASFNLLQKRLRRTILRDASERDPGRGIIIQEKLDGEEFGLDVVNDLSGNHQAVFVKQKLSMRAGETDRALTIGEPRLEELGGKIGMATRHVGNLDCDVFFEGDTPIVLEMNPRFGGGYPFSHIAGANIPAALVAWASGRQAEQEWLSVATGVAASKYDLLVRVANPTLTKSGYEGIA